MKKYVTLLLVLIFASINVLSACSKENSSDSTKTTETASTATETAGATMTYEEWENSWEDAPWADLYKDNFVAGKKLDVDYTYRTTPSNVQRTIENGNLYLQGWPIVKDIVTLKVLAPKSPVMSGSPEENFVLKNLEKKTNIHIEWTLVPNDQYKEKLNVIMASGDLPDIIIGAGLTPDQQMKYGEKEGLIIPLHPLIDKYGDQIKKVFEIRPLVKKAITSPTDNIYALPQIYFNFHVRYAMKGWINKKWLDALNLEVPTTIEEYEKVLLAFQTQDPNGNGKQDEIPLTGSPNGWNTSILGYFMNPFVLNTADHTFIEEGKVKFAPVTPEYKEGLKWLKNLYDRNLFDSSVFTMKGEQLSQLGLSDPQVVGSFPGGYFGVALGGATTGVITEDYVPMPPLKGPTGNSYAYHFPYDFAHGSFAITKANKHPEVSMRWVDWFYSPEALMAIWQGKMGEEWEYAKEGEKNLTQDRQAQYTSIKDVYQPNNEVLHFMSVPYANATEEQYINIATIPGNDYNTKQTNWTKELYEGHEMEEIAPPATLGSVEDSNDLSLITPTITAYIDETASNFIIGKMDIDKDWDHYVAQLEKMNLSKYLEIKQKQYDAFKGDQ